MTDARDIAILAFDGVQILDVTGPASVFGAANQAAKKNFYRVHILSADGGEVQSNCTVAVSTRPIKQVRPASLDTMLIAGGSEEDLRELASNKSVRKWVLEASARSARFGSICTGTFVLGHFGLIDGKRVTTHWASCARLAKLHPQAQVDANALYVEDGKTWTSAGVTAGIDMSLAMVARDLGDEVAHTVAKHLVLYARRPGYQSQFSPVLNAQAHADAPFADLIDWMRAHISESLDVPRLAARCAMSDRSFHRKFTHCFEETPAHFVETLRLDQTRTLLAAGLSLKEIAAKTGYNGATQLVKAFQRRFGVSPSLFREMHVSGG